MHHHKTSVTCFMIVMCLGCELASPQPAIQPTFEAQIVVYLKTQQFVRGLALCLKRIAANAEDEVAFASLEMMFGGCATQNRAQMVEERFRGWTQQEPDRPVAHVWLGAALATQPEREAEAEAQYREALRLDPRCPDAHFRLAALWERQGKDDEAQVEWKRFLELEPDSDRAWLVRHRLAVVSATPLTQTPRNPVEHCPAWSPDGRHFAVRRP